jgi:hypothetical protein
MSNPYEILDPGAGCLSKKVGLLGLRVYAASIVDTVHGCARS